MKPVVASEIVIWVSLGCDVFGFGFGFSVGLPSMSGLISGDEKCCEDMVASDVPALYNKTLSRPSGKTDQVKYESLALVYCFL